MWSENRKIADAYRGMCSRERVDEGIGSFIKKLFKSRTKDMPFGNPRGQSAVGTAPSLSRDYAKSAGNAVPPKTRNAAAASPSKEAETPKAAPAAKAFGAMDTSSEEFNSLPRNVRGPVSEYSRRGFEVYRQSDDGMITAVCAVRRNGAGINDIGVYAMFPVARGGDVRLLQSVLANFSSAGVLWVNASKGATDAAVAYLESKMESTDIGGNTVFYRRYGRYSGALSDVEKQRIASALS